MTNIELRTLAPEYNEDHHGTYVSRLNAAVVDPRNKNIALTGRYGAGKSSILDQFIKEQIDPEDSKQRPAKKVLRISINTLGPDEDDLTNRIQKELVKQLVYRAKPGELRTSRFARAPELAWWRAGIDALVATVVVIGLLWLFGVRPNKDSFGTDSFLLPMLALLVLTFALAWALRWYVGRRIVSQFSTGGASISFEEKTDSFFDKYLDELVAFFEATEPDIVVFEDLDRFDDAQIFDSLRELNTLINTSAHWQSRSNRPLRFVYAIKDSLFEKLGDEQQDKDASGKLNENLLNVPTDAEPAPTTTKDDRGVSALKAKKSDTAAEAVERANRTKFFEIVIPVVPFLSHSNARDHFLKELKKLGLPEHPKIDHGLIDVVARHTTDMRLMINIGNEFVVYAERLLWIDESKVAPGLTADRLFALVVYKNFHLTDFEALPHRGSALDTLEKARRDLVNAAIKDLQNERSDLARGATRQQRQQEMSTTLGRRLAVFLESARTSLTSAKVGGTVLDVGATNDPSFWLPIGRSGSLEMKLYQSSGHTYNAILDRNKIAALFPEAANADDWLNAASSAEAARQAEIDEEISVLRGADFMALVDDERYQHEGMTFGASVARLLPSQLARDLVRQGYIDRFYAEYATVFFGDFLGVDVANFFRNSVWPNEMDMQFPFTTEGAVANVLEQAPADFLRTRSALNIDIVDHLMGADAESSSDLIGFLARENNKDGQSFLKTYLNHPDGHSAALVSLLAAEPWPQLFNFIASKGTIDADGTSIRLLSDALLNAPDLDAFKIDDATRTLIARLHADVPAFRDSQPGASVETLFAFLASALLNIPSLRALSPELQKLAVKAKRYELTADNVRTAAALANEEPMAADNLIAKTEVWEYCVENIDDYLALVKDDSHTASSCISSDVLFEVVNAQYEEWSDAQMKDFLEASAESASLPDLNVVEAGAWTIVVVAQRAIPNIANLEAYVAENGIDDTLAGLLTDDAGGVVDIVGLEDADEEQLEMLTTQLLNADEVLTPLQRVLLAVQLLASPKSPGIELSEITASPDTLLAELLLANVVTDDEVVFEHFSSAGWASIGPALQVSANAATFITPTLIHDHVAELLNDDGFPEATKRAILGRVSEFALTEDQEFLISAASCARKLGVQLPVDALLLISRFVHDRRDIVWQLHEQSSSIPARAAMQILGQVTGDFTGFAGSSGHKFEVADTEMLEPVLEQLRNAGAIAFQPGRQPRGRWKLRVV